MGYKLVGDRVVGRERGRACETSPNLPALREAVERGEKVTPQELRKARREFFEALGTSRPWTAEKALDIFVWGLIRPGAMVWTGGQTAGGVLLGVRVVGADGREITTRQALVREYALPTLVWLALRPLPPLMRFPARLTLETASNVGRLLDPDRRSLGDLLAGTRIVAAV